MCSIDWTAVGTWVNAIGSLLGAAAIAVGVIVAFVQLRSINANEVIRTTVEYLNQYSATEIQANNDNRMSPAIAVATVTNILTNPKRRQLHREYLVGLGNGSLKDEELISAVQRNRAAANVAANYFIGASGLLKRGRLDRDLFFETLSSQLDPISAFADQFKDVDVDCKHISENPAFIRIVDDEERWFAKQQAKTAAPTNDSLS